MITHLFPTTLKVNTLNISSYPTTRYQGSKRKLLSFLDQHLSKLQYRSALDLFAGSGIVSLYFRSQGKDVHANDYMRFSTLCSKVLCRVDAKTLEHCNHKQNLTYLLDEASIITSPLVYEHYKSIYFTDKENLQIDRFCQNVEAFDKNNRELYIYLLGQALLKKRPYNLFHRANLHIREANVDRKFGNAKTWETPFLDHCISELKQLLNSVVVETSPVKFELSNLNVSVENVSSILNKYDLVFMDPPYIDSNNKAIDYSDFYHFLEGMFDYSLFNVSSHSKKHKPMVSYVSDWSSVSSTFNTLKAIASHFKKANLAFCYRSDSPIEISMLVSLLKEYRDDVQVYYEHNYKYALSRQKGCSEVLIIAK